MILELDNNFDRIMTKLHLNVSFKALISNQKWPKSGKNWPKSGRATIKKCAYS